MSKIENHADKSRKTPRKEVIDNVTSFRRNRFLVTLLVTIRMRFSLRKTIIKDITFGLVRMYVTPYRFSWTIFILGLALSYTDKLLVF